jgi:hypothetical protein
MADTAPVEAYVSPRETAERLKRWSQTDLCAELRRDIQLAAECIEDLVADFDAMLEEDERQQREDEERRYEFR